LAREVSSTNWGQSYRMFLGLIVVPTRLWTCTFTFSRKQNGNWNDGVQQVQAKSGRKQKMWRIHKKVNKLQNEKNVGNGKRFNGRTFSILPLKGGYTLSNIPISSMVLMQVLSDCGLVNGV
jgi:hypothetical protein